MKAGFALIRVAGSAVNHDDISTFLNTTLGLEVSGTVVALGRGCARLQIGDKVWGTFPWEDFGSAAGRHEIGSGGMADYASVACSYTRAAPTAVDVRASTHSATR